MRILKVKRGLPLFYVDMLSKYYPKGFVCVIPCHSLPHTREEPGLWLE